MPKEKPEQAGQAAKAGNAAQPGHSTTPEPPAQPEPAKQTGPETQPKQPVQASPEGARPPKKTAKEQVKGQRSGPEEKRLQGHWLLAKMGKKVLRPGGIEMTQKILAKAQPSSHDRIVEFGPGLGHTARKLLALNPTSYRGIDPNPQGSQAVKKVLASHQNAELIAADAKDTGLPDQSADLVIGEAMLTMQGAAAKKAVLDEAFRILAPGGRYAIHEMGLHPDHLDEQIVNQIYKQLSRTIKVQARPLTSKQWVSLLEESGFQVRSICTLPMALLEPKRLINDEGVLGALRMAKNMVTNPAGRKRVLTMRKLFRKYNPYLNAIGIIAYKPR